MEYKCGEYRSIIEDNIIKVFYSAPPKMVTITPEGTTISDAPSELHRPHVPFLAVSYEGDGYCEIDLDCGPQRWHGTKQVGEVILALRNLGLQRDEALMLVSEMQKKEQSCPHYR